MAKTINTRIQLKYDSIASWQTNNPTLLAGEIACVSIGEVTTDNKGNRVIPPIMMKVGPGAFNDLGWTAAKAADVYTWAKKETPDWTDFPALPIEIVDNGTGKFITDITYTGNKITITRDDAVNSIAAEDASLYFDKPKGDVKAKVKISEAEGNILTLGADGLYVPSPEEVSFPGADNEDGGSEDIEGTIAVVSNGTFWYNTGSGKYTLTEEYVNVPTKEYVDNIDTGVMSVTGNGAIATTGDENVEVSLKLDNTGNVKLTQGNDGLKADIDLGDYATTDAVDTAIDDAVKGLLGENVDAAYDTFKELQDILDGKEEGAQGLIDEVAANKAAIGELTSGKVAAPKADVASSLDATGIEQVKGIKVNSATNADEAAKVTHTLTINGEDFDGSANKSFDLVKSSDFDAFQNTTLPATYKALQTPVENPTANGNTLAFIDSISQNANGEITVTKKTVDLSEYTKTADLPEDPKASGSATIATKDDNGVVTLKASANLAENHVLSNSNDADITLHKIATSGSIYDVAEGSNSGISKVNGEDVAVEYLIFNCGSATTII